MASKKMICPYIEELAMPTRSMPCGRAGGPASPGRVPVLAHGLAAFALCSTLAGAATAAPLPDTPDTLLEQSRLQREARDRVWDPAAGQLGNLRQVRIVADGCTVRVVSGAENRLIGPREGVQVTEDSRSARGLRAPPHDVTLAVRATRGLLPRGTVCLTLQVATADYFILSGNDAAWLFDRVELPALRIYLNPSAPLRLWFQDVRLGLLSLSSNATALAGGTGQVQWLKLDSSQSSTALLFHEMNARHIGVSATTTKARFSIRIAPDTQAGYYQPARAGGALAQLYPIWVDGPLSALEVPAGSVDAMPVTAAVRNEARALREAVLGRAGLAPLLPPSDPGVQFPASSPVPVSQGQRVADAFESYLPPGVSLSAVQVRKAGGALEGAAPDAPAVRALVQALSRSPDVRHAQLAYTRPQGGQGGPVAFRVLFDLSCAAPGEASVCLAGAGGAYTEEQIRAELLPLLGPGVTLNRLQLRERQVHLEGRASDAEAHAALERIGQRAPWLQRSTSAVGKGSFWARLRLVCAAPPAGEGGLCRMAAVGR